MATAHSITLDHDDGWQTATCSCGWSTGPVPGHDIAAEAWAEHYAATLPADVLVHLAAERAPADEPHVIKIDAHGWVLRHPLRCRLADLFTCPYNLAARQLDGPPGWPQGEYVVALTDDGNQLRRPEHT